MSEIRGGNKETLEKTMLELEQLPEEIKRLRQEIEFATKTLDAKVSDSGKRLDQSLKDFEDKLSMLDGFLDKQLSQEQSLTKELSTLVLLPEKLSTCVRDIVPLVAKELANINATMNTNIFTAVLEKFSVLQKNLETIIEQQQASLTEQQEKLNNLTNELTTKALGEISLKRKRFLISLAIITLFAVGISALTSYLVMVKYPRFVSITGARDLTISESHVRILDAKLRDVKNSKDTKDTKDK